jgi:succinate dehydrogenase / fumarate reductase membrane anchor subunit
MVANKVNMVTSFGRSGVSDWLVQRVSAVILLAYVIFLVSVFVCNPDMDYRQWKALCSRTSVEIFTTLALFAAVAHAWIGMWSVLTDYVTARFFKLELGIDLGEKATVLRLVLATALVLLMFVYTLWGLKIIWGA